MTPPPHSPVRILAIDDMPSIHDDYRKILQRHALGALPAIDADEAVIFGMPEMPVRGLEFALDSAYSGEEGLQLIIRSLAAAQPYAVAFVDMRMPPGWDGIETIKQIWAVDADVQIVICTAYSDYSWTDTVRALGHPDNLIILKKPFDHIEVQQLAYALARKWLLGREVKGRLSNLDELVRQRTHELYVAEERFSTAFNASPLAQCLQALSDGRILEVNSGFEACFAVSRNACIGSLPEDMLQGVDTGEWRLLLDHLNCGGLVDDAPLTYRPPGKPPSDLRWSARQVMIGNQRCAIWIVRDVTAQVAIEAQLRQSQKMEAVGQLAAGIAHDFNNLLTVIECYTSELLADEQRESQRVQLESVQAAAVRAATLTRQLLVFSRKEATPLQSVDTAHVLRELQPMLHRLIHEQITIEWDIPPGLPPILAETSSLEQIVINLVVNARDALSAGGRIRVAARVREFAGEAQQAESKVGCFVAISVADNGPGIAPDVLPRIFEPFFTTKKAGQGTGLGLATVYSLAHQAGGWIDVQTKVGVGTTFSVFQPVLASAQSELTEGSAMEATAPSLPSYRVLAAEDDDVVREMLHGILQRRGLSCTLVSDGPGALAAWENEGPFDLLISDIAMPNGLTGVDVARALRQQDPNLPVVFITGYSNESAEERPPTLEGYAARTLTKPFSVTGLMEAINAVCTGALNPVPVEELPAET